MLLQFIAEIHSQFAPLLKTKKLKVAALAVVALISVNLLLYIGIIMPWTTQFKKNESMLIELKKKHANAVQFNKQKQLLNNMQIGAPTQKDMPLFVKEFVQTARTLHLSVASIKYDISRRTTGEPAMLAFSFPVEGKYPDIKRFIYEVETSSRFIGIKNMKLTSDKGVVKIDLKLITYIKN